MDVKIDADEWRASNQKLAELQVENERLKEALKEYGRHKNTCAYVQGLSACSIEDCSCGLEQAQKGEI